MYNNNPNQPDNLFQYKSDGITIIPAGGTTNESTVVFKGTISDPDNDQVKLQIEFRPMSQPFTGDYTHESGLVSSGGRPSITVTGITNGSYHWKGRTVDSKGAPSAWKEAGDPDPNVDLIVSQNQPPTAGFSMSAQGKTATENQTLSLNVAQGQTVDVSFSVARSTDPDGTISAYEWKIDGIAQSTSRDFPFPFGARRSPYQIFLTVTDNQGLTNSVGGQVQVTSVTNQAPIALFCMSAQGKTACENQTLNLTVAQGQCVNVSFSAARSSDPDGYIASYKWYINGTPVNTNRDFTYCLGAGTHQIFLEVWDNLGARGAVGATIVVQ